PTSLLHSFPTRRSSDLGRALAAHVEKAAAPYLAPEFPDYTGRAALQDLFGLGALTYLIFTGRPPAKDRAELSQVIQEHDCLTPADRKSTRLNSSHVSIS